MSTPPSGSDTNVLTNFDASGWKDRIEMVTKLGVAFVGICYVVGLIVMNMHVRRFGVNYLSFLQIEFVMVGFVWVFLTVFICVALYYCYLMIEKVWKRPRGNKRVVIDKIQKVALTLFWPFAAYGVAVFILIPLTDGHASMMTMSTAVMVAILVSNSAVVAFWFLGLRVFTNRVIGNTAVLNFKYSPMEDLHGLIVVFAVWLGILALYTEYVYPNVSRIYGGGRQIRVEMLVKHEGVATLNQLGFPLLPENRKLESQNLILESSDYFVISPPSGFQGNVKGIRLNKDLFDAVLYLSDDVTLPQSLDTKATPEFIQKASNTNNTKDPAVNPDTTNATNTSP